MRQSPESSGASTSSASASEYKRKPRSCDACRLRKIACSFRKVSSPGTPLEGHTIGRCPEEGAGLPERCRGCIDKGIECIIANKNTPFRRKRAGKNIDLAIAHGRRRAEAEQSLVLTSVPEKSMQAVALAGKLGHALLARYSSRDLRLLDRPPFRLPIINAWELEDRFIQAGGRLSELDAESQVSCAVLLALGVRLSSDDDFGASSRADAFNSLFKQAQLVSDANGIWRKSTITNITNMLLLSQAIGDGHIGSRRAQRYRRAAIDSLEDLLAPGSHKGDVPDEVHYLYLALTLFDTSAALENRAIPDVPMNVLAQARPGQALPDVHLLAYLSRNQRLECMRLIVGVSFDYFGGLLRSTALYMAGLNDSNSLHSAAGSTADLFTLWTQWDAAYNWTLEVKRAILLDFDFTVSRHSRNDPFPRVGVEWNFDVTYYLNILLCLRLLADVSLAAHLKDQAQLACRNFDRHSIADIDAAADAARRASRRSEDVVLCIVQSALSDEICIDTLAMLTGFAWSVDVFGRILSAFKTAVGSGMTPGSEHSALCRSMQASAAKVLKAYPSAQSVSEISTFDQWAESQTHCASAVGEDSARFSFEPALLDNVLQTVPPSPSSSKDGLPADTLAGVCTEALLPDMPSGDAVFPQAWLQWLQEDVGAAGMSQL